MIDGKKVVATIEGRMTSSRLPGKILLPLSGRPGMAHMIERHRRSKLVDAVVVATTTNASDDPVVALCEEMKCAYFRGSENDVFARVAGAGEKYGAEFLLQGMADCPLVDHRHMDICLTLLASSGADVAGNEYPVTFPLGFNVRAYKFSTFRKAEQEDTDPAYREHAGYSIRSQPEKFRVVNWEAQGRMRWPSLRLTLDTPEDYTLISAVYDALYPKNSDFSAEDVVQFLRGRPDLVALNSEIKQKVPKLERG